jgi:hypothetical protein
MQNHIRARERGGESFLPACRLTSNCMSLREGGGERARFCLHPDWYSNFFFQIEDCLFILHVPGYHTMALLPGTCLPSNIDVRLNIILGPYVYVLDADP